MDEQENSPPVKRGRGRPRKHPKPEEATPAPEVAPEKLSPEAGLAWAEAVLWAVENINDAKMTRRKAGSKMRFALWEYGQEYPKELVGQMAPKAVAISEKNKSGPDEESIVKSEQKSIAELEELLEAAIADAGL